MRCSSGSAFVVWLVVWFVQDFDGEWGLMSLGWWEGGGALVRQTRGTAQIQTVRIEQTGCRLKDARGCKSTRVDVRIWLLEYFRTRGCVFV